MGVDEPKDVPSGAVYATGSEGQSDKSFNRKEKDVNAERYGSAVLEPGQLEEFSESTKRGLKSRHAQMIALGLVL